MTISLQTLQEDLTLLEGSIEQLKTALAAKVSGSDISTILKEQDNALTIMATTIDSFATQLRTLKSRVTNLTKNTKTVSAIIYFTAPAAGTSILTASATVEYTTTYTNPDFPRRLYLNNWTSWTSGDRVKITGTDFLGNTVTEYVSDTGTYTLYVYREITSIDLTGATTGTVDISWSNYFGIGTYPLSSIPEIRVDGTIESYADASLSYGAVLFTTTPNGSHNYQVTVLY